MEARVGYQKPTNKAIERYGWILHEISAGEVKGAETSESKGANILSINATSTRLRTERKFVSRNAGLWSSVLPELGSIDTDAHIIAHR